MENKQSISTPQYSQYETKIVSQIDETISFEDSSSTPLLAWASTHNAKVGISQVTKQGCVIFQGAQLQRSTSLLAYRHCSLDKPGYETMAIFDISKKTGKARKIYSFMKFTKSSGQGDLAYNPRRNLLAGFDTIGDGVTHHWFLVGSAPSKAVKISSRDFDPSGENLAAFDGSDQLVISDVDTNNCSFNMKIGVGEDNCARCRWSTNPGEPLLFVKHDRNKLNILDVEKKILTLKDSFILDDDTFFLQLHGESTYTYWIDPNPTNGNLLVSGGTDGDVRIYDRRESKIVKVLERGLPAIHCVRWDQKGELVATAPAVAVKVTDFKTGKVIRDEVAPKDYYPLSVTFI